MSEELSHHMTLSGGMENSPTPSTSWYSQLATTTQLPLGKTLHKQPITDSHLCGTASAVKEGHDGQQEAMEVANVISAACSMHLLLRQRDFVQFPREM